MNLSAKDFCTSCILLFNIIFIFFLLNCWSFNLPFCNFGILRISRPLGLMVQLVGFELLCVKDLESNLWGFLLKELCVAVMLDRARPYEVDMGIYGEAMNSLTTP